MFDEPVFDEPVFDEAVLDEAKSDGPVLDGPVTDDDLGFVDIPVPPSPQPTTRVDVGWSTPSLVIGLVVVAVALSGLLDDSGLLEHPAWAVPVACCFAACAAVAIGTVRRLTHADDRPSPAV